MLTIVFPGLLLFVDILHPDMGLVQACYKPWCPGASSQWGAGGGRFSRHCNPGPHRQDALPQGYSKGDPQVSQYMVPGTLRKEARGKPCLKRTLHLRFGRSSAAYGYLVSQARPTLPIPPQHRSSGLACKTSRVSYKGVGALEFSPPARISPPEILKLSMGIIVASMCCLESLSQKQSEKI